MTGEDTGDRAGIRDLVEKAIPMLRLVRTLDIGAHYCRYCPAKSPAWAHGPSCPYVESQREHDEARTLANELEAALAGAGPGVRPASMTTDEQQLWKDHGDALEFLREAIQNATPCACGICWRCRVTKWLHTEVLAASPETEG